MPAGTSIDSSRFTAWLPRPSHSVHGVWATLPSPSHTSHAAARTIWPKAVRVTARRRPVPPQRSQVSMGVPGSARLPWQRSQGATAS